LREFFLKIKKLFSVSHARGFALMVNLRNNSLVVFTDDNQSKTVVVFVDKSTKIRKSGKNINLDNIQEGNMVEIVYADVGGKEVAKSIGVTNRVFPVSSNEKGSEKEKGDRHLFPE